MKHKADEYIPQFKATVLYKHYHPQKTSAVNIKKLHNSIVHIHNLRLRIFIVRGKHLANRRLKIAHNSWLKWFEEKQKNKKHKNAIKNRSFEQHHTFVFLTLQFFFQEYKMYCKKLLRRIKKEDFAYSFKTNPCFSLNSFVSSLAGH